MESKLNNVSRETYKIKEVIIMIEIIGIVIFIFQLLALAFCIFVLFGGMD